MGLHPVGRQFHDVANQKFYYLEQWGDSPAVGVWLAAAGILRGISQGWAAVPAGCRKGLSGDRFLRGKRIVALNGRFLKLVKCGGM